MPPRRMKKLRKRRASMSPDRTTLESLKLRDTIELSRRRSEVLARESERRLRDYHGKIDREWDAQWVASFEELTDCLVSDKVQPATATPGSAIEERWASIGQTDGESPEFSPHLLPFYDAAMEALREPERRQMRLEEIQEERAFMGRGGGRRRGSMDRNGTHHDSLDSNSNLWVSLPQNHLIFEQDTGRPDGSTAPWVPWSPESEEVD
ncbi:hypothetical protein B0H11DRAFT_2215079 [Mycena galericulata]|nr:hypothetical protein B0H11DRAFT_2215079 [Mycena galericulata]